MKRAIARHLRGERGGDDDPFSDRRRLAKQIDRLIVTSTGEVLDWRSVLRHAFPRRRLVTPDYLKPSRRFPARIGEIPGRTRRPPKPALLVGVDTSGSMSIDALTRVARELNELGRHARLTIMECDAAVHRVYPLAAPLGPFIGGGDTDFSPVFAAFHDARYDGLVHFTDGKGAMPASDETPVSRRVTAERGARGERVPTLWVLTHPDPFDAPFGSVVRLPVE